MSECCLVRCQQDRKLIRREFNKWTKNILLQIGLETISKNHFQYDMNSFNEQISNDFNPNQPCLFCINHQETLSNQNHSWINDEENSPLDLSLQSTQNLHRPISNQEELLLSSQMNFDYLFPNLNLFSLNPSLQDDYITQLAKQMAYSTRMLNEIFAEQRKVSRQGELLFVKKQNINNDDMTIVNTIKQHKHNNQLNPSLSGSSSVSSVSSTCSSSIPIKNKNKLKSNRSSTPVPIRQQREIIISTDSKYIRPKRGQYRRYESDQLAKAVAAVLSNEMSVHKAGSYFGVPHSTLEYKVKERNVKMLPITMKNKNELSTSMSVDDNTKYDNHNISSFHRQLNSNTNQHAKTSLNIPDKLNLNFSVNL